MKVSLNTIKQFTDIAISIDELVTKINAQLGSVETSTDLSAIYKDTVIVKIVSCEKHPAADRLNVCMVDDAGVRDDVKRDEAGLVQIVCGAPNVHAEMYAVWLPPRSVVPETYHDDEPFVLGARELRGVVSHGMLAAADELGIGSDHDGILEIDPSEWKPNNVEIKPGTNFAHAYGLDDLTIDIENKMFTHRPDLFGQLGVAREIAGIQQQQFKSPSWYVNTPVFDEADGLELNVFNDATEKVPRTTFVAIKDVQIKPSPLWLQAGLVALGGKPINNVVDVTNYIMLLTAQPTHAYDYDKIRGHTIGARMASEHEQIELLNGKSYSLTTDDIVISDGEGAIGLGGVMGGSSSEVSADTKNLILEVANFDMYAVRKSSMRHGIFTDALTRFNKGQSPLQNAVILDLLMKSLFDVAGGTQASAVFDAHNELQQETIIVSRKFINGRLGLDLQDEEILTLLRNVEIEVNSVDGEFTIAAPFWRTDLELPEDVVEEVGRLYGFENLPNELPKRSITPAKTNSSIELKASLREQLRRLGANEVLTYSFVHEKIITKAGQNTAHAYKIANALSPDLQYYRLSLTPSLLDSIHKNVKNRFDSFGLFELGKTHFKNEMDASEASVPFERQQLAAVFTTNDKTKSSSSAYYLTKRYLDTCLDREAVTFTAMSEIDIPENEFVQQLVAPYAPKRSAVLYQDNEIIGVVGEFKMEVARAFKLPDHTAGFEVMINACSQQQVHYRSLSRFPYITQDVSIEMSSETPVAFIMTHAQEVLTRLDISWQTDLTVISIYQQPESDTKSVTLRLKVANYERSLTDPEVAIIVNDINDAVIARLPPRS